MFGCALIGLVCAAPDGLAQAYTPPPPPLTTAPCVPTKKDPCTPLPAKPAAPANTPSTSDQFPFPGETPGTSSTPQTPADPSATTPGAAPASTADKFPFPGETKPASNSPSSATPNAPASPADKFPFPGEPAPDPNAPASSSSSSSSSSDPDPASSADSAATPDKSATPSRFARKHLAKVEDMDHREEEDVQVSRYYFSTGDFTAAYLRAKDAVKIIPDDPDAHYALAQSAERLKKNEEAVLEYNAYLKLDPDGPRSKAAQHALQTIPAK